MSDPSIIIFKLFKFNKEEKVTLCKTFKPLVDWYIKNKPELRYNYCPTLDCPGFYVKTSYCHGTCVFCDRK